MSRHVTWERASVRHQLMLSQNVTWCAYATDLGYMPGRSCGVARGKIHCFYINVDFTEAVPDSSPEFLVANMSLEQVRLRVPQFSLVRVKPPNAPFSSAFSETLLKGQSVETRGPFQQKWWFLEIGEYQIERSLQLYLQSEKVSPLYIFFVLQTFFKREFFWRIYYL
jgi:hypothetical protein